MKKPIAQLMIIFASFAIISSCKVQQKNALEIWSSEYLSKHSEIVELMDQFQKGSICSELKTLRTDTLTHSQMAQLLQSKGYRCEAKPLYHLPNGEDNRLLTKSGGSTLDRSSKELVYQEIWLKGHCSVRIKPDGFPGTRRPYPHANKAIIIETNEYSYSNEAFKITNDGQMVPKGPGQDVGMVNCISDAQDCKTRIDEMMRELHPILKAPSPGTFCLSH